jgi:putative transposase
LAQRLDVAHNFVEKGYSVRKVIKYASLANSTWYNQRKKVVNDHRKNSLGRPVPGYTVNPDGSVILDDLIVSALQNYRSEKEFSNGGGYQKLSEYLRRDYQYYVNPKKIYRLCSENDLLLPKRKKRKRQRSKRCTNRVITKPYEMWELDLKYGYVHGENRLFFIMAIIDVYMRLIVNYYIGLRCTGNDLAFTLEAAIKKHEILDSNQLVIRSDNGSRMTSNAFINHINRYKEDQVVHELIPPSTPNKNAHIEAFNSILEIEFLQPRYFMTYGQAYQETVGFMEFYNTRRIHGALKKKTPMEAYKQYKMGQELGIKAIKV